MRWTPTPLARLAASLVVVALLPLAFATWQLTSVNSRSMQDQVLATNALAARTTAEQMVAQLDAWQALALSLSSQPTLTRADGDIGQLLSTSLRGWTGLGVRALAVFDPSGGLVAAARSDERLVPNQLWREPTERSDHADASSTMVIIDPTTGRSDEPLVDGGIVLLRAAIEPDQPIGYVVLAADRARLDRPLDPTELLGNGQLFALDDRGRRVAGQGEVDTLPKGLLEAALSGRVSGSGLFDSDDEDEELLAAFAAAAPYPLRVVSLQPREVAEAVATSMRRQAILVLAIACGLVVLLLATTWSTVVQPLRRLLGAQRQLAALSSGVPGDSNNGGLIADLETSFEALADRVRDSERLGKVFLGRYHVVELIGRGGMGTVFRGWDPRLERPVALKTVRLVAEGASHSDAQKVRQRTDELLREAVMVAQLNHPHVVTVYDFEQSGDTAFVAMELVDGVPLERHLSHAPLTVDQVTPLALALALALQEAHRRGVLHRDVKSPNVLLGFDQSIKLVDFGLAQLATAAQKEEGMIFGTPGYVAPEVITGEAAGVEADIFALGVVLYESTCGQLPYLGDNIPDTLRRTVRGAHSPLVQQRPQVPPALTSIIESMLQVDPRQRPSIDQIVDQFEEMIRVSGVRWRFDPVDQETAGHPRRTTRARAQWLATSKLPGKLPTNQRRGR